MLNLRSQLARVAAAWHLGTNNENILQTKLRRRVASSFVQERALQTQCYEFVAVSLRKACFIAVDGYRQRVVRSWVVPGPLRHGAPMQPICPRYEHEARPLTQNTPTFSTIGRGGSRAINIQSEALNLLCANLDALSSPKVV